MEDEYSESDLNSSVIESFKSTTFNFKNKLPDDRTLYKKDKSCVCCKSVFGIGIINVKKHFCKFCYRGICAKCSPTAAFHPEDKKMLRICNLCCEKTVEDQFSEVFNEKISEARAEKTRYQKEIAKIQDESQALLKEIYKLERLIDLEKEKSENFQERIAENEKLTEKHRVVEAKYKECMTESRKFKKEMNEKTTEINKFSAEVSAEKNKKNAIKTQITELKNKLSELQDEYTHRRSKGHKKKPSIVLSDLEKKEETNLNSLAIKNFEIEVDSKNTESEIEKILLENQSLDSKIKFLKQDTPDRLINNERNAYSVDEEEKIRVLRNKQRTQQATIEKLRLDLKLYNNRNKEKELRGTRDYDEEEDNNVKETTRPCARCLIF